MGGALEMAQNSVFERYKNAIQNMICFRNDTSLYVFWQNVYKHYRAEVWKAQGIFQIKRE